MSNQPKLAKAQQDVLDALNLILLVRTAMVAGGKKRGLTARQCRQMAASGLDRALDLLEVIPAVEEHGPWLYSARARIVERLILGVSDEARTDREQP
jgi:hypothetical protein